jgi:KDO2-lipid IV(A) lauroyltransferase
MAQHYLIPHALTKRFPGLTNIAWRIEAWILAALFQLLRWLPMEWSGRLCGWLFRAVGRHTSKFKTASRNLRLAFPDKSEQEIEQLSRETFYSLGLALSELIHMPAIWEQREQRLEFSVDPQSEALIKSKQPIVYILAHTGAWQLTNFLSPQYEFPASIIYAPETNPYLHKLFLTLRGAFKTRLVSRDGGMRALVREIKQGNSIGLAIDTRLDGAEMMPLFNIDAPTNTAPARLALKNNCPILPLHVDRLPNFRYRISVGKAITASVQDTPIAEQAIDVTAQINRLIEEWVRQAPGQWICLKRRWPREAYPAKKQR